MPAVTSVDDLRTLAKKRIPRWVFDYADAGSFEEQTLHANRDDFRRLRIQQRVMVDVSSRSQATSILGQPITMPIGIAPTGLAGFFHPNGEIHGAKAAASAGVPYCLSTVSICSIEDVRAASKMPFWFQIYIMRDRGLTRSLIERAEAAACSALVVTLDLPLQAQRHKDIKNGLKIPPRLTLPNLLEMACKPRWSIGMLHAGRFNFGNFKGAFDGAESMTSFAEWVAQSFDASISWKDIEWIRAIWPGKLILKGILNAKDARHALAAGADAIVVSNHGGRQLDGAPSSIATLSGVADAVGSDTEILFDGGIRTGQDVLKAMALGARCCLIGKSYLYGLAASGQAGVARTIEILRKEIDVTLALSGTTDVVTIDSSFLYQPPMTNSLVGLL